MRIFIGGVFGLLACIGIAEAAWAAEVPFVYSRCPRSQGTFEISGPVTKGGVTTTVTITVPNPDLVEFLPDTTRRTADFVAPCDLIYNDGDGSERILYSCIAESTPTLGCAALDAAVSFDAKTIAFSVFRGPLVHPFGTLSPKDLDPLAENTAPAYPRFPGYQLSSTEAQLFLVDVASGNLTALPHVPGTFDTGPAWLSDGRLAFTTTRANVFRTMPTCTYSNPRALQLYAFDVDGRNVVHSSPHALGGELHPYQLADGRVAFSSWQAFGALPFRHPNAPGSCGTLDNMFSLFVQRPDGTRQFALFGQHLAAPTAQERARDPGLTTHMAAHFLTQTSDGRVWTGEYYRANNLGLGNIIGFPLLPDGQEGPNVAESVPTDSSPYRIPGQVRLAEWSSQSDSVALAMPSPAMTLEGYADPLVYAGKVGHPAALPNNGMMFTWGVGACSLVWGNTDVGAAVKYTKDVGDNPMCDPGIYRYDGSLPQTTMPITHPNQMVKLVNRPEFHEFLARAVVPYQEIMGQASPTVLPSVELNPPADQALEDGTPFGVLGASSIIHRETEPLGELLFNSSHQFSQLGTDTVLYDDDELCGVRILAIHPNQELQIQKESYAPAGERVTIVGEFPVHKGSAQNQIRDLLGDLDTSFRVRFPANMPYVMQAIDCDGRTLNTDQTWQHLKPGERKLCNGCHVHSAAADLLPFETTQAALTNAPTHTLGEGEVPLLSGGSRYDPSIQKVPGYGYMVEFDRDIMPIFTARCVSCHGPSLAEAGLRLDMPRTIAMHKFTTPDTSTYYRLAIDSAQSYVPADRKVSTLHGFALLKPNLSKYVKMLNARGSLLYWKAANQRTDGKNDEDFPSGIATGSAVRYDVDFGPDHPTGITADELALLARWIDTGAGWGPQYTMDTIAPTLSLVGIVQDEGLKGLRIGTVDVGEGIDPASLEVCVLEGGDGSECVALPHRDAALAGVITLDLDAPLTNLNTEVRATVSDLAGNRTTEQRTVSWLLGRTAPPPPDANAANGFNAEGANCNCGASSTGEGLLFAALFLAWALCKRSVRTRLVALALLLGACTGVTSQGPGEPDPTTGDPEVRCEDGVTTWVAPNDAFEAEFRNGQTFIRWYDDAQGDEGLAIRYAIYKSSQPIDASLVGATLVADDILSNSGVVFGYGFTAPTRQSAEAPMMPFRPGGTPLPSYSGMWAATPSASGCAYYAVVSKDADGNVLRGPEDRTNTVAIAEVVSAPEPILVWDSWDRTGPYVANTAITGTANLPLHLVLHGSNGLGGPASDYGDYYTYFAPSDMGYQEGLGGTFAVDETHGTEPSLTLRHRDGLVRWDGSYAFETSWFGYVVKPLWAAHPEARAYPFTERRLLWLIDWTVQRYRADTNRLTCGGGSMGAWGSTSFCFRHPELFAAVFPDRPRTRQSRLPLWRGTTVPNEEGVEGPKLADGTTDAFDSLDSVAFAQNTKSDLPFYGFNCGRYDGFATWAEQVDMVNALKESRHGFAFAWNNGDHSTGSQPSNIIAQWYPKSKFALHQSYPAFSNSGLDQNPGNGDPLDGDLEGGINLGFDWRNTVDTSTTWAIELSNALATSGPTSVDVTPRRRQAFKPSPGSQVNFTNTAGGSGSVTVDAHGLVTIEGVVIPQAGTWTTLTLTKP